MVFTWRWRKLKVLEDKKKKLHKRSGAAEDSPTKRPDNANIYLCIALLMLISGFLVVCTNQTLKVALFARKSGSGFWPLQSKPLHLEEERPAEHSSYDAQLESKSVIKDVVVFPEEILLLIALPTGSSFTSKESLACVFGSRSSTKVIGIERRFRRVAVRCQIPAEGLDELHQGVALDQAGAESIIVEMPGLPGKFMSWDQLVFEILLTPTDVVLFAKGIVKKQSQILRISEYRCLFDNLVETYVLVAAQEVFRCLHPRRSMQHKFVGKKVTLKVNGTIFPSVAYYEPDPMFFIKEPKVDEAFEAHSPSEMSEKKHFLCSCTMIFNGAKFLKEWVVYHAHLGVERFFLYDNNSEDELDEAVKLLSSHNVTRHPWPWIKTQEAGFSYCAQQAQQQCLWMMFTDVDEFIFPPFWIRHFSHEGHAATEDTTTITKNSPILTTLITETVQHQESSSTAFTSEKVGQIHLNCLEFGPSGLTKHPEEGVMQGYTCRMMKYQRHKSIVLLPAISKSLLNVVHHFSLKPRYRSFLLSPEKVVINHYKYQAWEEFKVKFRRRVSAFVTDWKESKNLMSKDRTPGLGNEDTKPPDWEHQFCEVNDTSLKNYVYTTFGPVDSWQ